MTEILRLSDHPLSQQWLAQARTAQDRALAAQLLNRLKLVSAREFEGSIERELANLQKKLGATIAVYPVSPSQTDAIAGYSPFSGAVAKDDGAEAPSVGKRRKFGSEDRVGHVLAKLQERFKRGEGASAIECNPTLLQLKTQGIRHIVLVDDVCGSGARISDYWRNVVPRRIKSLLSLKKCELWIVVYAITGAGRKAIERAMPNFPADDHLITKLPEATLLDVLTPELTKLCMNYAAMIGMESSGLGYRGSACPVVFEHGCPNNAPVMLWANRRGWKALFPNRSIPTEMRPCFDEDGTERAIERLWQANQRRLAVGLLEALDHGAPLTTDDRMLLTLLGLLLRGISEIDLATRLLMSTSETRRLLDRASEMGLYAKADSRVTRLGRELVARFRDRFGELDRPKTIARSPAAYYPGQCEGKVRLLGKTDRGNGRPVPVEAP